MIRFLLLQMTCLLAASSDVAARSRLRVGSLLIACPRSPLTATGKSCSFLLFNQQSQVCEYGQECCCGECAPEMQCQCESGAFVCGYTDFCLGVPLDENGNDICSTREIERDECPADEPFLNSGTACATNGLICQYGQECCCGECAPEIECRCENGSFVCGFTDFCLEATLDENGNEACLGVKNSP